MHEGPGFGLTTGFAQNQPELKKYWGYLRKFGFSQIAQSWNPVIPGGHICCRIPAVKFNPCSCHQINDKVADGFKLSCNIELSGY